MQRNHYSFIAIFSTIYYSYYFRCVWLSLVGDSTVQAHRFSGSHSIVSNEKKKEKQIAVDVSQCRWRGEDDLRNRPLFSTCSTFRTIFALHRTFHALIDFSFGCTRPHRFHPFFVWILYFVSNSCAQYGWKLDFVRTDNKVHIRIDFIGSFW